ncbi:MAG: hypothetical protein HZC02_05165 [Candidatus Levybacteria bacterium]|nr:hypothetical protein [Candidatus Levybacteria bacterium]
MLELIPGILEKEWEAIKEKLELASQVTNTVHIDIMDGVLTPEKTFLDPQPFKKYTRSLYLEVHMMVKNPIVYLEQFAQAGFRRFLGHIEMMDSQEEFVAKAGELGEVGLAFDGLTSISAINVPIENLDTLLLFTGERIGKSGQSLLPERLEKISSFHKIHDNLSITVDGGINDKTILQAMHAGASRFVATSALFHTKDFISSYQHMKKSLQY